MEVIKDIPRNMFWGTSVLPEASTFIANVRDRRHPIGAALLRFETTGIYALYIGGVIHSCDQNEAKGIAKAVGD